MGVRMDLAVLKNLENQIEAASDKLERNLGSVRAKKEIEKAMSIVTYDAKARIQAVHAGRREQFVGCKPMERNTANRSDR